MALAQTVLTQSSSTSNATSYTTASISPSANALLLLVVGYTGTGTQPLPTVTSNGDSTAWTEVITGAAARSVSIFRRSTGSSPASGTVTVAHPTSGTYTSCMWGIIEFTGQDTGGTNGSGAIAQSADAGGTGTSSTVSLASAPASDSATVYGQIHPTNEAVTPRTNWTEWMEQQQTGPISTVEAQYRLSGGEQTGGASWTTSGAWRGLIVEIKAAAGGTTHDIAATGSGTSGGSAPLRVVHSIGATGTGTSDGSVAISIVAVHPLAATGSGTSDGSARLDVQHDLRATGTGTSGGSAALTLDVLHIGATGTGVTDGEAGLRALRNISATGSGLTGGDAAISRLHPLSATGSGQTDGSAAIDAFGAIVWDITATGTGATDGSAALRVSMGMTAFGTSQTVGSAALRGICVVPLTPGTGQTDGSVYLSVIDRQLAATGTGTTGGSANITVPTGYPMSATGASTTDGTCSLTVLEAVWFFSPPTHEETIQVDLAPLNRHTLTHAKTVYRLNGVWVARRIPPAHHITGTEGVDYFRGGREYHIPASVADELIAAGYSPTLV